LCDNTNALKQVLKVDSVNTEFVLDTGTEVSTVTEETCQTLQLKVGKCNRVLVSADGSLLNVLGKANIAIESKYKSIQTDVYVLKGSKVNLLGLKELRNLNLIAVNDNTVCVKDFDAVKLYPRVGIVLETQSEVSESGSEKGVSVEGEISAPNNTEDTVEEMASASSSDTVVTVEEKASADSNNTVVPVEEKASANSDDAVIRDVNLVHLSKTLLKFYCNFLVFDHEKKFWVLPKVLRFGLLQNVMNWFEPG
jgi:molybdopterin-binding protein